MATTPTLGNTLACLMKPLQGGAAAVLYLKEVRSGNQSVFVVGYWDPGVPAAPPDKTYTTLQQAFADNKNQKSPVTEKTYATYAEAQASFLSSARFKNLLPKIP